MDSNGVSRRGSDRCGHRMGHPQGSRGRRRVDQPDSAGGTLANLQLHSLEKRGWGPVSQGNVGFHPWLTHRGNPKVKMGRQPRSGDIPWLSAHSILNWIGGDTSMLDPSAQMSSILSFIFVRFAEQFPKRKSRMLQFSVVLLTC